MKKIESVSSFLKRDLPSGTSVVDASDRKVDRVSQYRVVVCCVRAKDRKGE